MFEIERCCKSMTYTGKEFQLCTKYSLKFHKITIIHTYLKLSRWHSSLYRRNAACSAGKNLTPSDLSDYFTNINSNRKSAPFGHFDINYFLWSGLCFSFLWVKSLNSLNPIVALATLFLISLSHMPLALSFCSWCAHLC